mgnify:FL=1|jgi:hypothetical protein
MELYEAPELFERVISYDSEKLIQVRLTVSTFRGVEYLSLRQYYLDFNEEWKPTPKGISMPLTIENSRELFIGLTEILSLAESKSIIEEEFKDIISDLYVK